MMRLLIMWLVMSGCLTSNCLADYSSSERWFSSLTQTEREELQSQLQITGFYLALVDGEFGPSTFSALTNFEESRLIEPDGVLNSQDRKILDERSVEAFSKFGLELEEEKESQLDLYVPKRLTVTKTNTRRGVSYSSLDGEITLQTINKPQADETFQSLFSRLAKPNTQRKIVYKIYTHQRFIVSGSENNRFFYLLFYQTPESSIGYSVSWTKKYKSEGSVLASFLASNSRPHQNLSVGERVENKPQLDTEQPAAIVSYGAFFALKNLPNVLVLNSEITPSMLLDFRRALINNPKIETLILNSPGGSVSSALVLAYEIAERGISTYILPDFGCYSACAFVFFAGKERLVEGELGVHQISAADPDLISAQFALSDILEALKDFNVPQQVVSLMLRTPPDDMYIFSKSEIIDFAINKD